MKHTRRDFLKCSASVAAGIGAVNLLPGCVKQPSRQINEIGLQVYTVRNELKNDWEGTLRRIAEIGYNTLEMSGFYGQSVDWFRGFLQEIGLKNISGGGSMTELQTNLNGAIEQAQHMGRQYLVCFWPWSETYTAEMPDVWKHIADQLNVFGKTCRERGLTFAYHNHDIEFMATENVIPFDLLLQNTDPDLVKIEVDIYWMKKGGFEAVDYFAKYPGRFPLWHVKDMNNLAEKFFACVGEGIFDFPAIFARAEQAGLEHIFVEQDEPKDAMACIRQSHDYLRAMRY